MLQVPQASIPQDEETSEFHSDAIGPFFERPQLASQIASDLMSRPRESGLLLTGPRRTGKSTFVREDLLRALRQEHDVHVVYIDLAAYRNAEPGLAMQHALRLALQRFDGVVLRAARSLGLTNVRLGGLEMNVAQAQAVYTDGVLDVLKALSRKAGKRLVVVIDEVQRSQSTEHGRNVLYALMRSSDRLNIGRGPGVRVVATGSHTHKLRKLTHSKEEAFFDATMREVPVLGADFVFWVRHQLPCNVQLDAELMTKGFDRLLHRPRELIDVCKELAKTRTHSLGAVDQLFHLLVADRAVEGKEAFVAGLRSLSDLEFALLRVMAETGPRFAPHQQWCRQRAAALMAARCAALPSTDFSQREIEDALGRLEARGIIWRGLGFAFENQRAAEWVLSLDPVADFCVDHDDLPRLNIDSRDMTFPPLLS